MSGSTLGSIARIGITAVGYAYGGPTGAALASIAGSLLFPPKLPGSVEPIVPDQPFTNSAEGLPLPEFFGTCVTGGNVIWDGGRRVITKKKKVGGKGSPSQSQTTRTYLRSYAIGLGKEIGGVRRLWRNGSLVYDRRPQQDGETDAAYTKRLAASDELSEQITFYLGTGDQLPDPTIEAALGVGNAPAYRRRSYMVLRDMDETPRAGAISTWKIEVGRQYAEYQATTEYVADVLYDWVEDALDCRDFRNDHTYVSAAGAISFDDEEDMLAYLTSEFGGATPVLTTRNLDGGGGYSSGAGFPFLAIPTNPFEKIWFAYHDREPARYVDCRASGAPADGFAAQGVVFDEVVMAQVGSLSAEGGNGMYVLRTGLAGIDATPPDGTAWFVFSSGVHGTYGAYTIYLKSPVRIIVTRVPSAEGPTPPGSEFPDWSVDPENYTQDPDTLQVYSKEAYGKVFGDFRWLSLYAAAGNSVVRYPLSPAAIVGSDQDTEASWTAARDAAVDAGDLPSATNSYDATGDGDITTYPRNAAYAWRRDFLAVTISENEGVVLGTIVRRCSELADLAEEQIDVTDLTEIVRGFQLDSFLNARSAIDALRRYGFFDVVASGNQIKYPRRGKASVAQLELIDMGAHLVGEAEPERVRPEYLNDQELPRVVRVSYINQDCEYQRGQQLRGRTVTNSKDTLDVQVPVVMGADKAAQIRDVALAEKWIGREEYAIPARPIWFILEAADPIVFPLRGELQRAIITKNTGRPGGVQAFELRRDDASIYYPTATGVPSGVGEQVLDELGDTTLIIIDGPALREADNDAGVYLAARGEGERWRGYGLFQSLDGGSNYDRIFDAEDASTMGTITAALPVGPHHLWDRANSLEVTLNFGTLESRDEAAVAGGANPAWVGRPSRGWELVLFADAVLIDTDDQGRPIYTVSTFLRGRQGTEWAIGNSEAGDYFILADTCDRLPLDSSQIGVERTFKAVTFGKLVEAGPTQSFTPAAIALECFAPTLIEGVRDGSANLLIYGQRRARISGEWNDSDFVPLNEETEAYEVDVLDGVTVVRTISASSFPIAYSAADQATDFGSAQSAIDIVIYQLSATVGRGYPTEATV